MHYTTLMSSHSFRNLVKRYSLDTRKVLDVGCSEGHFLQHFGPGSMGVTIIEEHAQAARDRGLNVVLKNAEDPEFSLGTTFDVVWANNLFEHLHAPHLFLMRMREQLTEDGTLILGVPVIPTISWLTRFKKFRGSFAVSHINFFTRRTLIETVRAAGWQVQEARLFFSKNMLIDWFLNLIAPHIYVVATPKKGFAYAEKRLRSLKGY